MKFNLWLIVVLMGIFPLAAQAQDQKDKEGKADLPDAAPFSADDVNLKPTEKAQMESQMASSFQFRISGQITSAQESELSFRVLGFVNQVIAKPGDEVKKGEPLAQLDAEDFKLAYELAEQKLRQARIAVSTARKEYEREKLLKTQDVSTASMFDQVKANYDNAVVGLRLAELNLTNSKRNVEHSILTAPYDLIVAEQFKHQGEYVGVGAKAFKVYAVGAVEVDLKVPEQLAGKVKVGTELMVSVPSVQYKGKAKVTRVVPVINSSNRTFKVVAQLENTDQENVLPGLFAEAMLK